MNSQRLYFPLALFLLAAVPAQAAVMYQCVDASGHKSFSNVKSATKGAKCTAMDLGPASGPSSGAAKDTPTPTNFPKVEANTQRARDTDRLRILEGELDAEKRNLAQAQKDLADQEANILPSERMQGGGISGGKVAERVQPFKDKVALHERNIEAIQKEISKLR